MFASSTYEAQCKPRHVTLAQLLSWDVLLKGAELTTQLFVSLLRTSFPSSVSIQVVSSHFSYPSLKFYKRNLCCIIVILIVSKEPACIIHNRHDFWPKSTRGTGDCFMYDALRPGELSAPSPRPIPPTERVGVHDGVICQSDYQRVAFLSRYP